MLIDDTMSAQRKTIMFLAKVTGSVVATQKTEAMVGHKLLVVEPYRLESEKRRTLIGTGRTFVSVDTVGAGEGEFVLVMPRLQRPADAGNKKSAGRRGDHRHRRYGAGRSGRMCLAERIISGRSDAKPLAAAGQRNY